MGADAFKAEVGGLFWAGSSVAQMRVASPVCFSSCDNLVALRIAEGLHQSGSNALVRAMRALHACAQFKVQQRPGYAHVTGRSRDVAHELANALVEAAAMSDADSGLFGLKLGA